MPAKKGKEKKKGTELAVKEQNNALGHRLTEVLTEEQKDLIKNNFAKFATDDELNIYFNFCEKAGVDPLRGQSHFIKYKATDKPIMMIGIDGFQARAVSDSRYEGMAANAVYENDEFKMNPVAGEITHSFGVKDRGNIVGAYAILKRKGMPTAVQWVKFSEYDLNRNLWTSKKEVMIVKVSKATLLRREYPDSFSNVYVPEEFGAEITEEGEFIDVGKGSKQPEVVKPEPTISKMETVQEPEVKENDKRTEDEPEPETPEVVVEETEQQDSEEQEENALTIIPKEIINDIEKPRYALETILEYMIRHELGKRVKPVVISHYKAWETGEPSLCNIPEINIIKIVEELTGVKLKKKEKSCKCSDCNKRTTEEEDIEQGGRCLKCFQKFTEE